MHSLPDWLKTLGLEQFASVFVENEVDFDTLRLLTDQDLQDLGLAFGPRKKLLHALAALNGTKATAPAPVAGLPQITTAATTTLAARSEEHTSEHQSQ